MKKWKKSHHKVIELFALWFLLKSNKLQHHTWCEFNGRKVWTVNIKDVKCLTVKLANDSEEISSIKHKLKQLKTNKNMHNNKHILTHCKIFLYSNKNRDSSRSYQNSTKYLSLPHQVTYVTSKKLSSVR